MFRYHHLDWTGFAAIRGSFDSHLAIDANRIVSNLNIPSYQIHIDIDVLALLGLRTHNRYRSGPSVLFPRYWERHFSSDFPLSFKNCLKAFCIQPRFLAERNIHSFLF